MKRVEVVEINSGANQIDKFVGLQLRKERKKRHLSLMDVSKDVGISYQQLQKYEQAKSRLTVSMLYRIVRLYGLDFGRFFEAIVIDTMKYSADKSINCVEENKSVNVLIVEPDPSEEVNTRGILQEFDDLNALFVHDGRQVLDVLKYKTLCPNFPKPNVVFLDVYIPKLDGIDVLKELKRDEKTKDIPIVMLTNIVDDELTLQAYKYGASGYIIKNRDKKSLRDNIVSCINYWTKTIIKPSV